MRKKIFMVPLFCVIWLLTSVTAYAGTVNVSELQGNTTYSQGDVIHNDTSSTFTCHKSIVGGGAISSITIPAGEDYTLESNYVYGNFTGYNGFYSFICVPNGIQTITVDEGDTVTISKNDGYTVYDNGVAQLTYTWTELDENNEYIPYRGFSGESITITDVQCSRNHHKFKMEIEGWSQMYDDSHRPPQMYFELIVNHNEEHHHYPEPSGDDSSHDSDDNESENQNNQDNQETKTEEQQEAEPTDEVINNGDADTIKEDVGDSSISVHNVSLAITPGVFTTVVKNIDKKTPATELIYLYSAWPIAMNKNMLQGLANCKNDVVYYFWHKGHLYSITIPAKTDASKIVSSNWKYEVPLYIGQKLGTSKLIK